MMQMNADKYADIADMQIYKYQRISIICMNLLMDPHHRIYFFKSIFFMTSA